MIARISLSGAWASLAPGGFWLGCWAFVRVAFADVGRDVFKRKTSRQKERGDSGRRRSTFVLAHYSFSLGRGLNLRAAILAQNLAEGSGKPRRHEGEVSFGISYY